MPLKKWQPPPSTVGPDKVEGGSVVLIGNFNPVIFQPLWFAKQGILPEEEAKSADIQIVHREVTSFSLEWLGLQVTQDRFTASTADAAHLELLRDLVLGTFSVLEHTPLRMMGMNGDVHHRLLSQKKKNLRKFGDNLISKEIWGHIIDDFRTDSLRVAGRRPNFDDAVLRITVEPSARLVPGFYLGFNEHYEAEGEDPTQQLLTVLNERWRRYQSWTRETAGHIVAHLTEGDN